MKRKKSNTAVLFIIAGFLLVTSCVVVYADFFLYRIFKEQQNNMQLLTQASAIPVLLPTPTPTASAKPTPTPEPARAQLVGDIPDVRFPEYDTGIDAEYNYQSDELRIAVNEVNEDGVTYYIADIWMRNVNCFRTAFSSGKFKGKRESAEKISRDNNAILAVNGDFLGGLVIRNGELYRKATLRPVVETEEDDNAAQNDRNPPTSTDEATATPMPEDIVTPAQEDAASIIEQTSVTQADQGSLTQAQVVATASRPERATCVLYYDGSLITEEYKTFRSVNAMEQGAWQGWQFGPTLVRNGSAMTDVKAQGRNPRCVIGYYEPGHYCLILIDGRRKGYSIGMNFKEIIELCTRLGLKEAYNLDGGGSAIMTFNGKIINQPSGSSDARSLPDMVVIGDYLAPDMLFVPTPEITPAPIQSPEVADIGS